MLTICSGNVDLQIFHLTMVLCCVDSIIAFFFSCEKVMATKLRIMITRDSYSRFRRKDK